MVIVTLQSDRDNCNPWRVIKDWGKSFLGSIAFYTVLPLFSLPLSFHRIARFAPGVGVGLGAILGALDVALGTLGAAPLLRSSLVVCLWLGLTGGLHLDGAMDTADGLGVRDPQRRLAVMQESQAGAFGVMVAIVILLLKTAALTSLQHDRWLSLCLVAGWGRWSQVVAIARYPYLKPEGKGQLHRQDFRWPQDWLLGLGTLVLLQSLGSYLHPHGSVITATIDWGISLIISLGISLSIPAFFQHKFGGQTGDTYGAIVEWTEVLMLLGRSLWHL